MARRNDNFIDDLFSIATRLIWWHSLVVAALGYAFFHHFAIQPPPEAMSDLSGTGSYVAKTVFWMLSKIFQYLIPGVFTIGAIVSLVQGLRNRQLLDSTLTGDTTANINALSWQEFEQAVGEAFRRQGYSVQETPPGPDGGVDLVLTKGSETFLVQCKQWKSTKVGVDVARSLFGVVVDRGATGGFVVASGNFTKDAAKFTEDKNISLYKASELLTGYKVKSSAPQPDNHRFTCPQCRSPMVLRTAKRGKNAGGQFWGCSRFPACRATLDI